jgi:hypothetical protein
MVIMVMALRTVKKVMGQTTKVVRRRRKGKMIPTQPINPTVVATGMQVSFM